MGARFYSVDPNTTNQSTETWYLSADEARQADLAAKFLGHPSQVIMPENSNAAELARKSSEQLAQVTQDSYRQKVIPTPLGALLSLVACNDSIKDDDTGDFSFEGETYEVGCDDSEFDEIQDAVDTASDGDIIEVCDGTYPGFNVEDKSLTIKAKKGENPKIDLSTNEDYGEISITNPTTSGLHFILSGFEIYEGSSTAIFITYGNGIINLNLSNLEIHNSSFGIMIMNNDRTDDALGDVNIFVSNILTYNIEEGGLYVMSSWDDASHNLDIDNFEAYGSYRFPAINIFSEGYDNFTVTANNLNVHDNNVDVSERQLGSGIVFFGASQIIASIDNSEFTNNTAYNGAGIYVLGTDLTLTNVNVEGNVTTNPDDVGGGLHLFWGSKVTAYNTNWNNNQPYDVYVGEERSSFAMGYNFGTDANFTCEYDVGCTDL